MIARFDTSIGRLEARFAPSGRLLALLPTSLPATSLSGIAQTLANEIIEYLSGRRETFDIAIEPSGTPFQEAVWAALRTVPYGCVATYGDIARQIGKPGAAQAVGRACSQNPVLLLTPCHRIVGKNGSLTGFSAGLDVKAALLALEAKSA